MELPEPIEEINKKLKDEFGIGPDELNPAWRIVFVERGLTEKRWMDVTDEGFQLLNPEVREVPKYQHIKPGRYVLERQVPVVGETDITTKTSYEPAWTFEDRHGNYLPPIWQYVKFLIDNIYSQGDTKTAFAKYTDPTASTEARYQQVLDMEKYLFGDETPVADALHYGDGISMAGLDGRSKDAGTE